MRTVAVVGVVAAALLLGGCRAEEPVGSGAVASPAERTPPSCTVPARLAGLDVERLPLEDDVVALTFDAGSNADGVASIRHTLRRMQVPATFFLTGDFAQEFPRRSRLLARRDLVGNHTMTHSDLTNLTDREVVQEVRAAQQAILTVTGEDPRRFFRFPFGARTDHLIRVLNDRCYVPFRWTVDSLGWQGTFGGQTRAMVVARVLEAAEPGAIVLMHVGSNPDDGTTLDADALPAVIRGLRAQDYRFVRLSAVLRAAP